MPDSVPLESTGKAKDLLRMKLLKGDLHSVIPVKGDLCNTLVYLLEEAIFSVIPVKTGI